MKTVSYNLTYALDDNRKLAAYAYLRTEPGLAYIFLMYLLFLCFPLIIASAVLSMVIDHPGPLYGSIVVALLLLYNLVKSDNSWPRKFAAHRIIRRATRTSNVEGESAERAITIDDNGLAVESPNKKTWLSWECIVKCDSTDDGVFFVDDADGVYYIPRRVFADDSVDVKLWQEQCRGTRRRLI